MNAGQLSAFATGGAIRGGPCKERATREPQEPSSNARYRWAAYKSASGVRVPADRQKKWSKADGPSRKSLASLVANLDVNKRVRYEEQRGQIYY